MSKSNIEWTESTWNPIVGCSIVSPGCTNCYAMKTAARNEAMGISRYDGTTRVVNGNAVWTGKLAQAPDSTLLQPLKRKKPTTYFVNSMSDLFHEDCPDAWIDRVFAVMALTPQHTYQVLTKRVARMRDYFCSDPRWRNRQIVVARNSIAGVTVDFGPMPSVLPLPNVWLGVSTEDQVRADERRGDIAVLAAQGWTTFVSYEPALGPIDWTGWEFLKWLISGGESGPRPSHPDWHRAARDFCAPHGIAYFFKQWGNWHPEIDRDVDDPDWRQAYPNYKEPHFQILNLAGGRGFHGERVHVMRCCSKKAAGRLLDGVEHNGMPARCGEVAAA